MYLFRQGSAVGMLCSAGGSFHIWLCRNICFTCLSLHQTQWQRRNEMFPKKKKKMNMCIDQRMSHCNLRCVSVSVFQFGFKKNLKFYFYMLLLRRCTVFKLIVFFWYFCLLTLWYSSLALLSSSRMSMGRGSATPLALPGSALSGDSLWAWSASCFTILEGSETSKRFFFCWIYIQIPRIKQILVYFSIH